jgi:hypothetical protein
VLLHAAVKKETGLEIIKRKKNWSRAEEIERQKELKKQRLGYGQPQSSGKSQLTYLSLFINLNRKMSLTSVS